MDAATLALPPREISLQERYSSQAAPVNIHMETQGIDQRGINVVMLERLFHRKSLDAIPQDAAQSEHQLRRALGPLQLTLLGIGAIIGAGIFATIGTAAAGDLSRPGAGPALMVSFVVTAIVCGFTALCYAEFASFVPISGSAYSYTYATLGIISCLYLVYYLPPTSWLRFAAWLNCGFVIYVGYGAVHSRLTGRQHSERPAEHNAYTAYLGAWLAFIGMALLFCTRGVDLWLEALKKHAEVTGLPRAGAALAEVLRSGPWLELSWFLIIPLALTACVLCPIIVRRAVRARHMMDESSYTGVTMVSLTIAIVLGVAAIVYMLLVFVCLDSLCFLLH